MSTRTACAWISKNFWRALIFLLIRKLRRLGRRRLDTVADGNCQFVAIAHTAQIPISSQMLRVEVCQYLLKMEDTISD